MTKSISAAVCVFTLSLVFLVALESQAGPTPTEISDRKYWIDRKAEFIANTTFPLSEDNLRLIGGNYSSIRETHLPFWFDFELFKAAYKKTYPSGAEELARHYAYVRTCVRTLKARVLFRILAGTRDTQIEADSDRLSSDPFIGNMLPEMVAANYEISTPNELAYHVKFDVEQSDETPIAKAVGLVRQELDKVESRNQLVTYIKVFNEVENGEPAIPYDKMPFLASV